MTSTLLIAGLTALMAGVGSFVTWRIAKRNTSGAIDTSVAADLWAEGGKIRGELREDLAETKAALGDAVAAVTSLSTELRLSREEAGELKAHITALTAQITELHRTQLEALNEVKTHNTLTLGGMADNEESRRIMNVPKGRRTAHEDEHLRTASERLPADLAASQEEDDDDDGR